MVAFVDIPPTEYVVLSTKRNNAFDPPEGWHASAARAPLSRMRYPDGHIGWVVTEYSAARSILADLRFSARSEFKRAPIHRPGADSFYGRPALPGWFVDMDPPDHTRLRRLLTRHFTLRAVQRIAPRIQEIVDSRLAALDALGPAGNPVDVVAEFALPVPARAICELLGVPYEAREEFERRSTVLFSLTATAEEGAEALTALTGFLGELIAHKRAAGATADLLGALACDDTCDPAELAGIGVLLLTAGHETVSAMLGLSTFLLLTDPAARAAFTADGADHGRAVEELLRYLTVFQFGVPRTPLEDVEYGGVTLRAGESVTVLLPAANRDAAQFGCPAALDFDRAEGGHLAFGHGLHSCVGQNLARAELRAALPALFRRFPGLTLAVPPQDVPLAQDMGVYGVHRLPVTW